MIQYSKTSPYSKTDFYNNYLDVWTAIQIPKLADDVVYTIPEVYRCKPNLLAFDLYQDARLWWVFAVRNPNTFRDPIFDFIPGISIYIPKKQTLIDTLGL